MLLVRADGADPHLFPPYGERDRKISFFFDCKNSPNSLYKSGSRPQKSPKVPQITLHSIAIGDRYGIFWMISGDSSCPDDSENEWQRGKEMNCIWKISICQRGSGNKSVGTIDKSSVQRSRKSETFNFPLT